jgi:hypothetical protein
VREHRLRVDADFRSRVAIRLNDSTEARLTRQYADSLDALRKAAKQMGGTLIAGVRIVIKPETLYVPVDSQPTTIDPDSTRRASVTDTTANGTVVRIDAVAPPFPAPLSVGYEVRTPPFTPQVGFVRRKDGYYAVVSLGGHRFETSSAFYAPERVRPLSVVVGGTVAGSPDDNALGATLHGSLYGALKYTRGATSTQLRAGVAGRPFVGLAIERTVW